MSDIQKAITGLNEATTALTKVNTNVNNKISDIDDTLTSKIVEVDNNVNNKISDIDDTLTSKIVEMDQALQGIKNEVATQIKSHQTTQVLWEGKVTILGENEKIINFNGSADKYREIHVFLQNSNGRAYTGVHAYQHAISWEYYSVFETGNSLLGYKIRKDYIEIYNFGIWYLKEVRGVK